MGSKDHIVVAAIDFGTTFSGYAFSFLYEYQKDPTKSSTFSWTAESGGLQSLKTSSCILFDKNGIFHSCGFEAETKYADLALENKHGDWLFFERFKMNLYKQNVRIQKINRFLKHKRKPTVNYLILKLFPSFFRRISKDSLLCKQKMESKWMQ